MFANTENGALALASTTDVRLDLFFKTVRDLVTPPATESSEYNPENECLIPLIDSSWALHPLDTLKILFNWRDAREGKGDRHGFIQSLLYLSENHFDWVEANIGQVQEFGRYLDLIHLWHLGSEKLQSVIMNQIVKQLEQDLVNLGNKDGEVSLLAKWIPSENAKWDRFSGPGSKKFCTELCKALFSVNLVKSSHHKRLRKTYLVPLRQHLSLIETRLCKKDFEGLDYSTVPSIAMTRYRKAFGKNDGEAFQIFLESVKSGEKKINSKVYPHTLVSSYLGQHLVDTVIEEQWKTIKAQVDATGAFEDSISVVDVSGSMSGIPMNVAIALGLLSLNESNGHNVISFSREPILHKLNQDSLLGKVQSISRMEWGMNTDLIKVFNLVLQLCDGPRRIKKIFIFSDMQFDQATTENEQTHFEIARAKFAAAGMELPQIIFWNLRGVTDNFPVTSNQNGVVMLSGYSPALLTALMEGKDVDPLAVMLNVIRAPRYDCIKAPDAVGRGSSS